ncbi:MAG TPA: hypothetical protein VE033_00200 [Acetobacteraceae bacterium]|nr:hypothetical protein [Acetobacteraceae bacterium]
MPDGLAASPAYRPGPVVGSGALAAPSGPRAVAELAALVRESVAADAPRHVLRLAVPGPHPHRALLREALAPALAGGRTRIFELRNGDLIAVSPPPATALKATARSLATMLEGAAGASVHALCLPDDAALLLDAVAGSMGLRNGAVPSAHLAGPRPDEAQVAAAARALRGADLSAFTRAERVCRLDPEKGTVTPLWEERRVDMQALAALLLPGLDLFAAPDQASRLRDLAETRLMAEAARIRALAAWRPFGLTLSPAILASDAFHRFDAALPLGRRAEVVIALRAADLEASPGAAEEARRRGFRVALEEVGMPVPAAVTGLDLLRLRWSPALAAHGLPWGVPAGVEVVLAGADSPAAIAWGWERGIRLFQGPALSPRQTAA